MSFPRKIVNAAKRSLAHEKCAGKRLLKTGGRYYDPIYWTSRIAATGCALETQRAMSEWARGEQRSSKLPPERSQSAVLVAWLEQQICETGEELAGFRNDLNRALSLGREG